MKGQKTGGRQKGTPNKATKEMREFFTNFFNENKELFMQDLLSLEPLQRLSILPKIMPFVMPKAQAEPENNDSEQFLTHDSQNRFLDPSLEVWRNMADNIRSSMNDDIEEQEPLEGTPFSPFTTSDTISDGDAIPYNDNGQHPQSSTPSNNSAPSDLSDSSASSDNSELSAPSSTAAPSLTPIPKRPVPRKPFYKALDLKKTHNKRRKRR